MPSKPSPRRPVAGSGKQAAGRGREAAGSRSGKRANLLGTRPQLTPPAAATAKASSGIANSNAVTTVSASSSTASSPPNATSRLCVKHLPLSFAETEIYRHFSALSGCEVTDVRLMRTPDGRSRQLAFIGYRSPAMAAKALHYFDRNFIRTSRIAVSFALEKGSAALARPWSKWSSQQSQQQQQQPAAEEQKEAGSTADSQRRAAGRRGGGLQSLLSSVLPAASASSLSSDSLFQEYLQVMGGKGQRKVWDNDEAAAAGQKQPTETEEQQEEKAERERLLAALDDDGADSEDEAASAPQPLSSTLSDADYLKYRQQTAAFDGEADEEEDELQQEEGKEAANHSPASVTAASVVSRASATAASSALDERRLFVRNLPFSVREEDLRSVFSPFGAIDSLHIPLAADGMSKGFAFVSFVSAASASRALAAVDGKIALGRILHVLPSQARPSAAESEGDAQLTYKKRQELQRKAQAGKTDVTNTLFLRPDTVMASMADRLSVSKAELLDVEAGSSLAVRLALAETQLIAETKTWLAEQGVNVAALERRERLRAEPTASVAASGGGSGGISRSSTVILVKNIPYETELSELRTMFGAFGELRRVVLPPSRSLAIVVFHSAHEAKKGFTGLAYSKFHHSPLYLEWAPVDTMSEAAAETSGQKPLQSAAPSSSAPPPAVSSPAVGASDDVEGVTIFVKNLSFSSSETSLLALFAAQTAVRSVHIATKKNSAAAVAAGGPRTLSMGFGFVELRRAEDVLPCIQRMQGAQLDGHSLQLSPSTRSSTATSRAVRSASAPAASRRVIVKNLPFEATAAELRTLLSTFGSVSRVRLPRKFDGGHRGFAFVDFVTAAEAAAAKDAVTHTHLYGRPVVLEFSTEQEEGDEDEELAADNDGAAAASSSASAAASARSLSSRSEQRVQRQREKVRRQYETSQAELPQHKKARQRSAEQDE